MNKKLGICIPTYKRPDQLQLCVKSVINAAAPYKVPIFIADDSVDDTNTEVLKHLSAQYPYVFVTRNRTNLGIDGNILNSVNICNCDYAWMLGEDDRLLPDAVRTVLLELEDREKDDVPFMYVNYASVDAQVKHYLKVRALELEKDLTLPAEAFVTQYSWAAGFIGGCVVNTRRWHGVEQHRYIGTYFAHVGTILEMIRNTSVLLIARPLVLNRCGEPRLFTWSDSTFQVTGGWSRMMQLLGTVYPKDVCQRAVKAFEAAHGLYSFRFLCYARADYAYRLKHYHEFLKPHHPDITYRCIARTIACTPPSVFKAIRLVLTRYRRIVNPAVKTIG